MTISVITPSYNQAEFLPVCIRSVADQTVAPYEHLIFDPGSTDGSREIAASRSGATLIAEPDGGQADAVGKGFQRAKGDILGWLNSDDVYASNRVFEVVLNRFRQPDAPDIVYGQGNYIDASGKMLRPAYVNGLPETLPDRLQKEVGILQPALFIRKSAADVVGPPSTSLNFSMDYEYWIRAIKAGLRFAFVPDVLALARYYPDNKTYGQRGKSYHEVCRMVKSHFGYVAVEWLQRYAEFRVKGHDGILKHATGAETSDLEITKELNRLLRAFNGDHATTELLVGAQAPSVSKATSAAMRNAGLSLKPVARQVALDAATAPGRVCYTVGSTRWAFEREWKEKAVEKAAREFQRIRNNRDKDVCVIVGNGPSLNSSDLSVLQDADVFISNYAFLKPELAKAATYFTVVNHLVAEQGADDIILFRGPRKFFPYWLRYCLADDEDIFFVNSIGFDKFSTNIEENISWRSTVTFFNLQLAYGLGYRKVLMVGFDHYYRQETAAKEGDKLVCRQDDANHFDPNYFKNKTWQAADVGNMEKMYLLARAAFEADGREVVNCTVGGHLEVFRRGDLEQELRKAVRISPVATKPGPGGQADLAAGYPRLLMIDSTPPDLPSATGQLKGTLLGDWPANSFLQVWARGGNNPSLHTIRRGESMEQSRRKPASLEEVVQLCREFRPDAIYFRPVDSPMLMQTAEKVIEATGAPFALHMMDDWPERLRKADPALFATMDVSLRRLIDRAAVRWSICDKMSKEYASRYGRDFEALANGVDLADFPAAGRGSDGHTKEPIKLQYFGALAQDMTFESVMDIARAVADLQKQTPIDFRIQTMDWCLEAAQKACAQLPGVSVTGLVPWSEYHRTIADADIMVIAYNFDASSINYTRLSLANKMPECLASGAALLAYGPSEVATIDYLQAAGCACVVDRRDPETLKNALLGLALDGEKRRQLAQQARDFAACNLTKRQVRERFRAGIVKTAASANRGASPAMLLGPYSRKQSAHFDETDAVAAFLDRKVQTGTMLDVGAHHGYALSHFLEKGWKIWAFEPDAVNRAKLEARLKAHRNKGNVTLDTRCVTSESRLNLAFYQSEESTGISGLSAFRDSHREAQRVDSVSLCDYFKGREMPAVDFLKIDTEGHDLFVLQGFPWDRNKPRVIECEFEDLKTKPLGYTTKDMADFLVGKGYTVYVSEWHPIVRYGQQHDWHRLQKYPCEMACEEAWGNLLAFSEAPDETQLASAIKSVMKLHGSAAPAATKTTPASRPSFSTPGFRHTKQFAKHGPQEWLLHHDPQATQQLIIADFPGYKTLERSFVGLVTLESDQRVTVNLSVGRTGNKPYEGSAITLDLAPGQKRTVPLCHKFKAEHGGVKIQVDVKKCAAKEAKIRIETCALLADGHDVLAAQNAASPMVARANQLFREQKYTDCIPLYLAASRRMGSKALELNAQLALRRMGVKGKDLTTKILQELTQPAALNCSK